MQSCDNFNGVQYIVKSQYLPVIIDFGSALQQFDTQDLINLYYIIPRKIAIQLPSMWLGDYSVILSPVFDPLKEREFQGGELARIFSPITI